MQIILQATHGVVSGQPEFFKRAFGNAVGDFERILLLPHDFIFNRDWYEHLDGRGELAEYNAVAAKLSATDKTELLQLLSSCDPRHFETLSGQTSNREIQQILSFYVPKPKDELYRIWEQQKSAGTRIVGPEPGLAEDERVEDAGLETEDTTLELESRGGNGNVTREVA
jgi:hypothetical protein